MSELNRRDLDRLIQAAIEAREKAYAPHSHFLVGSAALVPSGEIFVGCNVENASYSLTLCAERVALSSAVVQGHRQFQAIAVASEGGVSPCGACRQFIYEFGGDPTLIMVDVRSGETKLRQMSQLLPDSFDGSQLPSA
ncbi:MAG: cytidine deaminase [Planctomycetota bacterium]